EFGQEVRRGHGGAVGSRLPGCGPDGAVLLSFSRIRWSRHAPFPRRCHGGKAADFTCAGLGGRSAPPSGAYSASAAAGTGAAAGGFAAAGGGAGRAACTTSVLAGAGCVLRPAARNFCGSCGTPCTSTSKCRCGPVERPVLPTSATAWPRLTRSPFFTSSLE